MGVRPTESRLPKELGFGAEDLGQVGSLLDPDPALSDDPDCFLISYLSSPLTCGSTNTYVVFVEDKDLIKEAGLYAWQVIYNGEAAHPETTDDGVFEFKPKDVGSLVVTVHILDANDSNKILRVLEIEQDVQAPNAALEELLTNPMLEVDGELIKHRDARGGHPDTTRELVNDLKPYIDDAFDSSTDDEYKVPKMLLAAVVYLQTLRVPKEKTGIFKQFFALSERFRNPELKLAAEELNGVFLSSLIKQIDNALGVCQIKPQTLAMILKNPKTDGVWEPFGDLLRDLLDENSEDHPNWLELSHDEKKRKKEVKRTLEAFNKLDDDPKIDLYNLLRFPKSNIQMCFDLLTHLKKRGHRYPNEQTADFLENEDGIQIIGTEFYNGGVESPLPTSSPPGEGEVRATQFGKDVLKTMYSPYLVLDFGGLIRFEVSGKVTDKDTKKGIKGAKVYLYKTVLELEENKLSYYKEMNTSPGPVDKLEKEEDDKIKQWPVLEVVRKPNDTNSDWVKVRVVNEELIDNEGWVVARSGKDYYAHLKSVEEGTYETKDVNGEFSFTVTEFQPYKIRTVKEPDGEDGYFDGETVADDENDEWGLKPGRILKGGWLVPPIQDLNITMESAKHMIKESVLVDDLLSDWKNYEYAYPPNYDDRPKYPDGYHVKDLGLPEGSKNRIVCNPFVEALVVEAWHKKHSLNWSLSQHWLAMIQKRWDVSANQVDSNLDVFSSVSVYRNQIITVSRNPDSGQDFTVKVGEFLFSAGLKYQAKLEAGELSEAFWQKFESHALSKNYTIETQVEGGKWRIKDNDTGRTFIVSRQDEALNIVGENSVTVTAGATKKETAKNIATKLNGDLTISSKVSARLEYHHRGLASHRRYFVVLSSKKAGKECDFEITTSMSENFHVSGTVFPAIEVDLSDDSTLPPPWSVVQGWSEWAPEQAGSTDNIEKGTILGHNLFIVDVHPNTERVLILESNLPKTRGPCLRDIGRIHELEHDGDITPNKEVNKKKHWTEKGTKTWDKIKDQYKAKADGDNPLGIARLKVYDLKWSNSVFM